LTIPKFKISCINLKKPQAAVRVDMSLFSEELPENFLKNFKDKEIEVRGTIKIERNKR